MDISNVYNKYMADFDVDAASRRQREILVWVEEIRDMISKEVINYYWDEIPESEEKNVSNREGMRKYLVQARDRINRLLDGALE